MLHYNVRNLYKILTLHPQSDKLWLIMALEVIRHSLREASGWIDEKFFRLDRDRAQMPNQILQEALRRVGYRHSAAQFTFERYQKGWVSVPFSRELLAITFNRISDAIDMGREAITPELTRDHARALKDIVHAFCYQDTMQGSPKRPAKNWLTTQAAILLFLGSGGQGQQVEIFDRQEIHKATDLMLQTGLMRQKPRKNVDYLYLTNQVDPLLA